MEKIEAQNVKLKIRNRKLKYELDKLKEIEEEHQKINGELRETINKTIEYIKNIDEEDFIETEHYVELLEILKGE